MTREQKYPETICFHYHNQNSHNRKSGDCVVRAISLATGDSWEDTLTGLFNVGIKCGYVPTDTHTIEKYLAQKGWTKCKQPRKANGKKYTGKEFCSMIPANGVYIANIGGGHIVTIKDKKVWDIWDSTSGCIGNYWVK